MSSTVKSLFESMRLGVDILLGALLIHGEDALLPLWVGTRDSKANVGDNPSIVVWNALPDGLYEDASFGLVIESLGQLGLSLHLSEEEVGGARHFDFAHFPFMDELDGRVVELLAD